MEAIGDTPDDEPHIVAALEFLLEREGYEVGVVGDGEEALAQVAAFASHLLVPDLMLPRLSEFGICERARAGPRGDEREAARGLAFGADTHLTRSFGTDEPLAAVHQLLHGGGARWPAGGPAAK